MIYVGIDVASTKHDIAVTNNLGEILVTNFSITNDSNGFKKLHNLLVDLESSDSDLCIGLESTGLYHLNLTNFLALNFKVCVINPLLTSMTRKAQSVRSTKTDKIDALAICSYLEGNRGKLKFYTPPLYNTSALKSLSRSLFSLRKQISKHKVELSNLISKCFPEYLGFFTVFHCASSYKLLYKYPTPSILKNTRVDAIANSLGRVTNGHNKISFARLVKDTAKVSVGDTSDAYEFQIRMIIDIIRFLTSKSDELLNEIKTIIDEHFAFFITIPGFSYLTAGLLIGEIGDVNRFSSFDKLLAYFGLDPIVYQSGNFNANNTKGSKRGSRYARYALFHASRITSQRDSKFIKYYTKKISEGKHYYVVLAHVSKKLLRVCYSILKSKQLYI